MISLHAGLAGFLTSIFHVKTHCSVSPPTHKRVTCSLTSELPSTKIVYIAFFVFWLAPALKLAHGHAIHCPCSRPDIQTTNDLRFGVHHYPPHSRLKYSYIRQILQWTGQKVDSCDIWVSRRALFASVQIKRRKFIHLQNLERTSLLPTKLIIICPLHIWQCVPKSIMVNKDFVLPFKYVTVPNSILTLSIDVTACNLYIGARSSYRPSLRTYWLHVMYSLNWTSHSATCNEQK